MQIKTFPVFDTPRLKLDQLTKLDRQAIFDVFSDPKVVEHYDVELFKHINEADKLVDYFDSRFSTDSGIRWAIREQETGEYIGSCGFTHWNKYDHSAVIGYEISQNNWGKGFASEAVAKIIDYIFSSDFHFYVHRIEALALPSNIPSGSLLKKLGFKLEGTLRGKCYWNDDFHDMDMYGLLREDRPLK
ncbi:GNAT family N-acetyltransferase [Aliiglaciecola lipolytica]|uniref:Ribosomal-protein-alanine N-acetyltransferase n=1 Tax=Aliiglaciecola lipolytica E3 TaxID=1127673 RepID=K6XTL1_9ALTE|nr:GNAT family protein [Aliiglaciecola lipolytica]GAC15021.1 ribosomal-protein-alanine N-acetyltransferase [Aliiglaciecola lipolytica E3]